MKVTRFTLIKTLFVVVLLLLIVPETHAQDEGLFSDVIKVRLLTEENLLEHKFVITSNKEINSNNLHELAISFNNNETVLLICTDYKNYNSFYCSPTEIKSTSDQSKIVSLDLHGNEVLLSNVHNIEVLVIPENTVLNHLGNKSLYKYLVAYESEYESWINQDTEQPAPILQTLLNIFLITAALVLLFSVVLIYPKKGEAKSFKNTIESIKNAVFNSKLATINYYILAVGVGVTIVGLLLVSQNDLRELDIQYIIFWVSTRIEGTSNIDSSIVLLAIFMYITLVLNFIFVLIKFLSNGLNDTKKELFSFTNNLKPLNIIIFILLTQILVTSFAPKEVIDYVSTINLLLLLSLFSFRETRKMVKTSNIWYLIIFLLASFYAYIFVLFHSGKINVQTVSYKLVVDDKKTEFLTPEYFEIENGDEDYFITSNQPIFLKDMLIYHPAYEDIIYKRIKDVEIGSNTLFMETEEERLINALSRSRDIFTLLKQGPSNYFITNTLIPSNEIQFQIICEDYQSPGVLDLSVFGQRFSQKDFLVFFPGCYKENIVFNAQIPEQDVLIPNNIYKIEGLEKDQIGFIKVGGKNITYLSLDQIQNRNGYSFLEYEKSRDNDVLTVGTDERTYQETRFYNLIKSSSYEDIVNLTPIITFFKKNGIFERDELAKIDSVNDSVLIEAVER